MIFDGYTHEDIWQWYKTENKDKNMMISNSKW